MLVNLTLFSISAVLGQQMCSTKAQFNDACVEDVMLIFSELEQKKNNYMMAYEITNVLQSQYVESGIVDFNFQCAVFDQAENSLIIGKAWQVDIPSRTRPNQTTNKKVVCMKGSKSAGQSLYINPRWNIIPQMELCQFYPSADKCGKFIIPKLEKLCRCGAGKAVIAKRGAGFVAKNYMKQFRGRTFDIFAFCDGIGC